MARPPSRSIRKALREHSIRRFQTPYSEHET
jgi:hypothetical protein